MGINQYVSESKFNVNALLPKAFTHSLLTGYIYFAYQVRPISDDFVMQNAIDSDTVHILQRSYLRPWNYQSFK